ncbi:g2825 [Coccomyxa viridis]|uniref:G2825 protein n=1 Tax=Coccomyxa viridis TaxID=1274662 RepID=A0ABP1FPB0_9CHLO
MEKQGRDLESAFEAGPSSSSGQQEGHEVSFKGVGTFQVDTNEKDRLLRKERANAKVPLLPHDTWQNLKLAGVVMTAALLAVFLLWLLFSGDASEKVSSTAGMGFAHPPLNASELARTQPQNGCPEREWLPEECIGSLREKSKKVYDHCELFFQETGYSQDLLRKCGIIAGTLP